MGKKVAERGGILVVCQELHMSRCGSSDPLEPNLQRELLVELMQILEGWTVRKGNWFRYDEAVRELIRCTIHEHFDLVLKSQEGKMG